MRSVDSGSKNGDLTTKGQKSLCRIFKREKFQEANRPLGRKAHKAENMDKKWERVDLRSRRPSTSSHIHFSAILSHLNNNYAISVREKVLFCLYFFNIRPYFCSFEFFDLLYRSQNSITI